MVLVRLQFPSALEGLSKEKQTQMQAVGSKRGQLLARVNAAVEEPSSPTARRSPSMSTS